MLYTFDYMLIRFFVLDKKAYFFYNLIIQSIYKLHPSVKRKPKRQEKERRFLL